jgi:nucleotide-binding universal stress UspA family protein
MKTTCEGNGRIIVGVDGSDASARALRWGAHEAHLRGRGLHVVTCWTYPTLPWGLYQPPLSGEEFAQEAREVAETTIEKVLGATHEHLDVTVEVLEGAPSLRLLELDHVGEMIVVGSRGHGGFSGLMLGSVSQHLAEHARCPVVIIHGEHEEGVS